jgi:hypothetical protein
MYGTVFGIPPPVCGAAVGKVDVAGPLVNVQPVQEVERHAARLRRHDLREAAARRHPEQPQVRVGDVKVTGLPVELQPQRPPAHVLGHHEFLLRSAYRHAPARIICTCNVTNRVLTHGCIAISRDATRHAYLCL